LCPQASNKLQPAVSPRLSTMAAKLPLTNMAAVAQWYLGQLGGDQYEQLIKAVKDASQEGRSLRVGTMCSGTDSPVVVLHGLAAALGDALHVEHTFSCEFDPKKQQWIKDNFPSLKMLFGDVMQLKTGMAHNYITNEEVAVPSVDIVIAGFVCKSVSTENNERAMYKNCIKEASGKTGETFDGVMGYVKRYKPSVVICENVKGLTTRNKGAEPVIKHVAASFKKVGYSFDYQVLDTRQYLLPQRRNRCWMWAFRGLENEMSVRLTKEDVIALGSEKECYNFDKLFTMAKASKTAETTLLPRQNRVVAKIMQMIAPSQRQQDILIDVAKSEERAPKCVNATSCIVPNSLPYRCKTSSILTPIQVCAVQGIFQEDFPALLRYGTEKGNLVRDLAGNAFSTTVCMAVTICCLLHAPLPSIPLLSAPSTPPRSSKKKCHYADTPPKTKRVRTEAGYGAELPKKRVKLAGA